VPGHRQQGVRGAAPDRRRAPTTHR
jgi:hypothetical protein